MAIKDENPSLVMPLPKETKQEDTEKESAKIIAEFKKYQEKPSPLLKVIGVDNLVTNLTLAAFLAPMAAEIKAIHGEVVNPPRVELLQQLRMDTLAAAYKKHLEENENAWMYFATAAGGILVTLIAAGVLMRFGSWVISKLPTFLTGGPAGAAQGLTPDQVKKLRDELALTNPALIEFVKEVKKLPGARGLAALAKAIGTLKKAVDNLDNTVVTAAAEAIKKIKLALANFDHKKIPRDHRVLSKTATALEKIADALGLLENDKVTASATAIGKLKEATTNFNPTTVRQTASATRTLTQRMADLRTEAGRLTTAIGT